MCYINWKQFIDIHASILKHIYCKLVTLISLHYFIELPVHITKVLLEILTDFDNEGIDVSSIDSFIFIVLHTMTKIRIFGDPNVAILSDVS